jgi:hypothetical protein
MTRWARDRRAARQCNDPPVPSGIADTDGGGDLVGLPTTGGPGARLRSWATGLWRIWSPFLEPVDLDREWPAALVQGGCNVSTAKRETQRGHRRLRSTMYRAHHVGARNHQFERFLSGGACDGALPPRSSRTPGAPSSGRSARLGPVSRASTRLGAPGAGRSRIAERPGLCDCPGRRGVVKLRELANRRYWVDRQPGDQPWRRAGVVTRLLPYRSSNVKAIAVAGMRATATRSRLAPPTSMPSARPSDRDAPTASI